MLFVSKILVDKALEKNLALMGHPSSSAFLSFITSTLADLDEKFPRSRLWGPRQRRFL